VNVRLGAVPPEFLRALPGFVKEGRGLMLFAGDRVDPAAYNAVLGDQAALLPMKIAKVEIAPAKAPWRLDQASADGPFDRFRHDEAYASVDKVEVRRRLALEGPAKGAKADPPSDVRVLLRCGDGAPAIVPKKRPGEGEVLLFTTSAHDLGWTTWFTAPSFVPFMQEAFKLLLGGRPELYNTVAGEALTYQPPREEAGRAHDLLRPDGTRLRLGLPASKRGRPLLTAADTAQAGGYRVVPAGGAAAEGVPFAVTPDLRERQGLASLTPAQLDEALGFRAVHLQAGDDGAPFSGAERLRREWTVWLLGALLALVLGEALLAWFCGRAW